MDYKEFEENYNLHDSVLNRIIIEPNNKRVLLDCTLLIPDEDGDNDSFEKQIRINFDNYNKIDSQLGSENLKKHYEETILSFECEKKKNIFSSEIITSLSKIEIESDGINIVFLEE